MMAEETPAAAPVAAPAVEAAPVVAAAAPEITPTTEAAVVTPAAAEGAASVAEPPKAEEAAVEPMKPLLGPEAEEVKADAPKTEEAKTETAPLPVYEFKLPEGASADNPAFKSFQSRLGEFQNLTKAEQAVAQKFGQDMLDMHLAGIKQAVENQQKSSWDWFNNRNKEWLESAKKDPQIGGDNFDATVNAASSSIKLYGGTKAQQIETARLLQETGIENSPVMLRFLSNITRIAAREGTPVGGQNAPTNAKFNPAQALFGGGKVA